MKEPAFNDASIFPLCETDEAVASRLNDFCDIVEFCGFLGFKKVRFSKPTCEIELKKGYCLSDYLFSSARGNSNRALLLLHMLKPPYIDDGTVAEERYANHSVRLKKDGVDVEVEGLAAAHFSGSFAIGFASEDYWRDNHVFTVSVSDDATKKTHEHKVFCVSTVSHLEDEVFVRWSIEKLSPQFRQSELSTEAKCINLRDDHGKRELLEFAMRIRKETYVEGIINSLPFDCGTRRMTNIKDDCLLEVRLLNTDRKIGIVVKTTAHNKLEAKYIAADIERKYSK